MGLIETKSFELAIYKKGEADAKKLALVLPGKLDTKDYPHMQSHVDYLAQRGFLALSFDPPGTWESPGDIELYTMTNYLKAINELIEYFENRPTFVMGHSRGGSMAMLAGIKNQQVTCFAAAMSNYSYGPGDRVKFPDEEWRAQGYKLKRRDVPGRGPEKTKEFKLPYAFLEDTVTHGDMLDGLRKCSKPKLFFYGERDVLAKPESVKRAYEESAEPREIHRLDSDHDYRLHGNLIDEVNGVMGEFLDKYGV